MSSPPNVVINIGGQQPVSGHRPKHGPPPFPPPSEGPEGYYGPPRRKEEHRSFFANMLIGASVMTTAATIVGAGLIYHYSPRAAAGVLKKVSEKHLDVLRSATKPGVLDPAKLSKQSNIRLRASGFMRKMGSKFADSVASKLEEGGQHYALVKQWSQHLKDTSEQFGTIVKQKKTITDSKNLSKKESNFNPEQEEGYESLPMPEINLLDKEAQTHLTEMKPPYQEGSNTFNEPSFHSSTSPRLDPDKYPEAARIQQKLQGENLDDNVWAHNSSSQNDTNIHQTTEIETPPVFKGRKRSDSDASWTDAE